MNNPVSAIVTCHNESPNIDRVLQSLTWCDEVLVVDSYSTDDTLDKARQYDTRILQREYLNPADQKNWAMQQAVHDWVLILDADEEVTPGLKEEIQSLLQGGIDNKAGYWIKRNNYFMGRHIRYSGWQRDKVIRLVDRRLCRYPEQYVHEEIEADGEVGTLRERINHYTFRDLAHYNAKLDRYARWSAIDKDPVTGRITWFHTLVKPAFRFVKHYVIDRGFLDGVQGWIIARMNASAVRKRYQYMRENRNNPTP